MIVHHKESSGMNAKIYFYQPTADTEVYDPIDVHPRVDPLVYKCWAQAIPQTGSLLNGRGDTFMATTTHKFIIRYTSKVKEDMYIKIDGSDREYNINYILDPYFKNETLEIFAVEKERGAGY